MGFSNISIRETNLVNSEQNCIFISVCLLNPASHSNHQDRQQLQPQQTLRTLQLHSRTALRITAHVTPCRTHVKTCFGQARHGPWLSKCKQVNRDAANYSQHSGTADCKAKQMGQLRYAWGNTAQWNVTYAKDKCVERKMCIFVLCMTPYDVK